MRVFMLALCRLVLRVFFRQIEIVGADQLTSEGPLIFIVNHPNGLIDPLFVLCLADRRVSFLAKEPLFRMFLVGAFVRAFECLPVYRKQDGGDPAKNREAVAKAIGLLRRGNAIALFPEGVSHSDPQLKPLKPGAARIALSATALNVASGGLPVHVVPIGLTYSTKATFRSKALMVYGTPVPTPLVDVDDGHVPDPAAVAAFTEELTRALAGVTVQAESVEAMRLAQRVERVLRAAARDDASAPSTLQTRTQVQQRLLDGYQQLKTRAPQRVGYLQALLEDHERSMAGWGLRPGQRVTFSGREMAGSLLEALVLGIVLLPLAVCGVVINGLTYRAVGALAFRLSKQEEDVVATFKVVAGLLFFPMTWIALAVMAGWIWGRWIAIAVGCVGPASAYAALLVLERASRWLAKSYTVTLLLLRPSIRRAIVEQRRAIRTAVLDLAKEL